MIKILNYVFGLEVKDVINSINYDQIIENKKNVPLCDIFEDMVDNGVLERLNLDKEKFTPIFSRLRDYWLYVLNPIHGKNYLLCGILQLREVLETPEDWEEIGFYLADATSSVYGNGSHQLVEEAVPALIDGKIVKTKDELKEGIRILSEIGSCTIEHVVGYKHNRYDGAKVLQAIGERIKKGEITSLEQITTKYPVK